MRKLLLRAAALLIATIAGAYAQSGAFPNKPVRIIVPYTPGGGTDIISCTLANRMQETWGQQVIVENRPGAGSTTAPNDINVNVELPSVAPAAS